MSSASTMAEGIPKFTQTQEIEVVRLVVIVLIKVSDIIVLLNNIAEFITDPDPVPDMSGNTYLNSTHGKYEM